MRLVAPVCVLVLGLAACSATATTSLSSPSPRPQSSPSPSVTPVQVRVTVDHHIRKTTNSLGDPIGELTITMSSNIPVTVDLSPELTVNGQLVEQALDCGLSPCFLDPGKPAIIDLSTPGDAPHGSYVLKILVPSYASLLGLSQEAVYTDWIGGPQGPRLAGNPQAIHDPDHPAVLDLQVIESWSY